MSEGVTVFDGVILGVLLISGLLALVRGFVREALSVAAFVLAALGALWMLPVLRDPVRAATGLPDWAADAAAVTGTFLLIFLAVTLVTSSLSRGLRRNDEPGMLDRIGGLAFGVARGLVVLAFFVIAFAAVAPRDWSTGWMTRAQLYPLVASTASALRELAPESSQLATTPPPPAATEADAIRNPPPPAPPRTAAPAQAQPDETGYSDSAADALDRLIGATAGESQQGDAR